MLIIPVLAIPQLTKCFEHWLLSESNKLTLKKSVIIIIMVFDLPW